jgi:hypothetical protein
MAENKMVSFNLPSPYQAELAKIADQQRMAEMLQAQSQAPIERFSYKGIEARTPATAGLAKLLQGFGGAYFQGQAREKEKALGEKYRAEQMGDMSELISGLNAPAVAGSAAVPERLAAPPTTPVDDEGNPMPGISAAPAVPAVVARQAGQIDPSMMGKMKTTEGANQVLALVMAQRQAQIEAERRANEPFNLTGDQTRFKPQPGGLPPKAIASGVPKTPFADLDVSKFTPESLKLAMNPDGTIDRTLLRAIPERATGELGVYNEYVRQQKAAGKIPMGIDQFITNQKIAGRPLPAVTYGSPVAAQDAQGNPVFLQPGKTGNAPSVLQGFTPPAEKLKQIPPSINTAIIANQQANNQLNRAINLLQGKDLPGMEGDVSATGLKGYLPTGMLNRLDPQGVSTRAEIADIGSLKLHDRSGAAVTASESPRLMPFIPLATDDAVTALKKLQRLKLEVNNETSAMRDIYSKDQGYKENPILNKPSVSEKITTMQEIEDVAKKTGKTVDEVKKDAEAKGYKVNQ